jgi:hypothetical protein
MMIQDTSLLTWRRNLEVNFNLLLCAMRLKIEAADKSAPALLGRLAEAGVSTLGMQAWLRRVSLQAGIHAVCVDRVTFAAVFTCSVWREAVWRLCGNSTQECEGSEEDGGEHCGDQCLMSLVLLLIV